MASDGYVVLTLRAFKDEDGIYASECVELDTASCGDSPEEAITNAAEATSLYLRTVTELGDRDRIFRERKIRVLSAPPEEIDLHANLHPDDIVKVIVLPVAGAMPISA